ncbi:DUF6879 family protein [Actinophytocola sp.]|uniref:DUF6879 family protein n=1 Tax=Actinophytocola sp. TaxID=1872138 RepID=UPI002D7F7A2A|nr:DUF6879 family protein [Actinophytocola sp.]HET9140564.1 hypothetical protein [Actinophytocola sp.]
MSLLTREELGEMFQRFERSAVRMEAQQTYNMPAERAEVRMFLAGADKPSDFNADWHRTVRRNAEAGKRMQRLKAVRRPFTDYTRFLFEWVIAGNVAAGEDYRILDLTERGSDFPEQDFWIFDESTVVLLNFNLDGTLRDRVRVDPADVPEYLRRRDEALKESVHFNEYRVRWAADG